MKLIKFKNLLIIFLLFIIVFSIYAYIGKIDLFAQTTSSYGTWTKISYSNYSPSPSIIDNQVSTSVTDTHTYGYNYSCVGGTGSDVGVCSGSAPTSSNNSTTCTSTLSPTFHGLQSNSSVNDCYNQSITVVPRYGKYSISVAQVTPNNDGNRFYIEEHNYNTWLNSTPQGIEYSVSVTCTPGGWKNACNPNYSSGDINVELSSSPSSWLSFSQGALATTESISCSTNCQEDFVVYPYFNQSGLPAGLYITNSINVCYSNNTSTYCSSPSPLNLNSSNSSYTSIGASVSSQLPSLRVYASWIRSTGGGNTYSSGGYQIANFSHNSFSPTTFSDGLIENTNSSNFLNTPGSNMIPSYNSMLLLNNNPIYNFNFFATLYCQYNAVCNNSSNNLYSNGILQSHNIQTSNSSVSGVNWYFSLAAISAPSSPLYANFTSKPESSKISL